MWQGDRKGSPICTNFRSLRTTPGRGQARPNRRQVKPGWPKANKRREVLGRSERPAMERPAACIIASHIRRRACVNDRRPQKPCASTTV